MGFIKPHYIIIILATVLMSVLGGWLTAGGMDWYKTLSLPSITPKGSFIGMVWTIIYILFAVSAIMFYNNKSNADNSGMITALFVINIILNIGWTLIFFRFHSIGWSIVEMIVLNITNLSLIILLWDKNIVSSLLLIPYIAWVSFATYLAWLIWKLNR